MKFIGNYKDCINSLWVQEILNTDGFEGKLDLESTSTANRNRNNEYTEAIQAGWNNDTIYWWRYTNEITSFDITDFPWLTSNKPVTWWIVKQLPGQVQPIHIDVDENNHCNRYWMPLQDYQQGHILISENKLIKDYKFGDVFQFDSALDKHGSANIGMSTRVVLLVTEHL